MDNRDKVFYAIFVIATQLLQFSLVFLLSYFSCREVEFIILFLVFVANRNIFGDSYHANKLWKCTALSLVTFYFLCRGLVSVSSSIFLPVMFALYFSYGLHHFQKLIKKEQVPSRYQKHQRYRSYIVETLQKNLGDDYLNEDLIIKYCISLGLTEPIAEVVYLYITNTKTETAELLGISDTTVVRRIKKFLTTAGCI